MRKHGWLAAALATTVAAGALITSSLLFANSHGAEVVANDASVQLRAEETLSAATVARTLLSEAVVLRLAGEPGETALQTVIEEASRALTETSRRADALIAALTAETTGLTGATEQFVSASRDLLDLLDRNAAAATIERQALAVSDSFDELTTLLAQERDLRERHIAAVRGGAGDVAEAARFLVAFVIPAGAMIAVLALVRQRQRRALQREENRRRVELRHARDEFLSAVAHELRTPLTAVVGSAQLLRNPTESLDNATREEMIDILADQAVALTDLVENLLIFARTHVGDLNLQTQAVDVGEVVDKITGAWSETDLDRLTVRGEAEVLADPRRLKQVLRNLLSNALRHGGERIEVRIVSDEPNILIQVADNGPGIPHDIRRRMFDPYEHGEAPGQPATLGLGLTVARSLAQRMGGQLTYHTRPTESLFALSLPAARLPVSPLPEPGHGTRSTARRITPVQVTEVVEAKTVDIVFQPIVELDHSDTDPSPLVVGVEALARFPVGSPEEWFDAAADAGLRQELELVAIRAAIQAFARADSHLFVSINLSYETLISAQLLDALSGLEPDRVVLELTEASIMTHYQDAEKRLANLRSRGYRLAVDDMGTAGTDLWHLVRLRPAFVKPDISLIRDSDLDADKRATLTGLHWLAHTLPINLIVEGIEQEEDIETLRRLRIDWAQGYLFGRPADPTMVGSAPQMPADEPPHRPNSVSVPSIEPPGRKHRTSRSDDAHDVRHPL